MNHSYLKYETFVRLVTKHIKDEINEYGVSPYFFTVTYKPYEKLIHGADPIHAKSLLKSFENGYARLTNGKYILGNNYQRKHHLKPVTWAWLDYPFTKWKRTTDGLTGFQKMKLNRGHPETTPHVHSIMLIHPNTLERFETLGAIGLKKVFRKVDPRVMTTDLQVETDVKTRVKYSSALMKYPRPELQDQDLYIVLPDPDVIYKSKTERHRESDRLKADRQERKRLDEMVARREIEWKKCA
ncbi:MAG: hypothetical protein CMM10_13460 [Rhodospirillaceae bacterium]|nr:hypothetical protein [Rhodospirillaceae bacterium]